MNELFIAQGITICLFFLSKAWEGFTGRVKEEDQAVKDLTQAINDLRLEMVEHRVEIRNLKDALQEIPEMKKDIDAAHVKLRNRDS